MSERHAIADSFGRAAASYDAHAQLQHAVARDLDAMIAGQAAPGRVLDLGAATAPLLRAQRQRWPESQWLVMDIALPMLTEAMARGRLAGGSYPVCADAMQLPLADNSVDLLFSSFALQWCSPLSSLAGELYRVIRPGGSLALSVPLVGTLAELEQSWRSVDDQVHVNSLPGATQWADALGETGFMIARQHQVCIRQHYPDLRAIGVMLKATGAHHVVREKPAGLTGRRKLARLLEAYEHLREPGGLPVTWQVGYLIARKPSL